MNKLASINLAIDEINKRAMFAAAVRGIGSLYRRTSAASNRLGQGIVSGASRAKSYIKPPVVSAGGAAANAQQQGKVMGFLGGKLGVAGLGASMLPKTSSPLP